MIANANFKESELNSKKCFFDNDDCYNRSWNVMKVLFYRVGAKKGPLPEIFTPFWTVFPSNF